MQGKIRIILQSREHEGNHWVDWGYTDVQGPPFHFMKLVYESLKNLLDLVGNSLTVPR
jgi:hypothetical protein